MTTTELIQLLQKNEFGGVTKKPRRISLSINDIYSMPEPEITLSSTGDGIAGPEIGLDITGYTEELLPDDFIDPEKVEKAADELDHVIDILAEYKNGGNDEVSNGSEENNTETF